MLGVLAQITLGINVDVLIIGQAQHADIVATYTNLHFVLDTIRTNKVKIKDKKGEHNRVRGH